MKVRLLIATALLLRAAISPASAEIRILGDPGGLVENYLRTFDTLRQSGERVVVDGPCLSACTLLLGKLRPGQACATSRATFGFHAGSERDQASRQLVYSPAGTRFIFNMYPERVRAFITKKGGLREELIEASGRTFLPPCGR